MYTDVYTMCIVINCLKMTQWQKFQHQQRLKCSSHSWQEKLQLYSSGCHNKGKKQQHRIVAIQQEVEQMPNNITLTRYQPELLTIFKYHMPLKKTKGLISFLFPHFHESLCSCNL